MKKWLIFSLVLILAGGLMFCIPMSKEGWAFEKLDNEEVTEMNYSTAENEENDAASIQAVKVVIHSTKFEILRSGTEFSLKYFESDIYSYDVDVSQDTLTVTENRNGWQHFFRLFSGFKRSKLTTVLTIPESFAGNLDVKCSNSDLNFSDGTYGNLTLRTTNGSVRLSGVTAKEVVLASTNGNVNVADVESESLRAETTNGSVAIERATAPTLVGRTTNGNASASNCSIASIELRSTNGDLNITASTADDVQTKTTNGRIEIRLIGVRGEYTIDGSNSRQEYDGNQTGSVPGKKVYARTTNGHIHIEIAA